MGKRKQPFSGEMLRRILDYDRETGIFRWRHRPECNATWNARFAGKVAGSAQPNKGKLYWIIVIGSVQYFAHQIAWLHVHDEWPTDTVDHRDGDGLHNWIDNLRLATQQQQSFNRSIRKDNRLGIKGIHQRGNAFRAYIMVNGKQHTRTFHDLEDAKQWHSEMAAMLHGDFAHKPTGSGSSSGS